MKYDPNRHCGAPLTQPATGLTKQPSKCTALKGAGTAHTGSGHCAQHSKPPGYYDHVRRNRLSDVIERARALGVDPSDVVGELELVRALLIAYIEEHTDLDDSESIAMTGELADRVMRAAALYRKMRQEEMIHKLAVDFLVRDMSTGMMKEVENIDPNLVPEWKQVLIERIRDAWSNINVVTSVRELKKLSEGGEVYSSEEETDG